MIETRPEAAGGYMIFDDKEVMGLDMVSTYDPKKYKELSSETLLTPRAP